VRNRLGCFVAGWVSRPGPETHSTTTPRPHGTLHPRVLSTHPSTIRTGIRVECFLEHEWNGSSDEFLLAGVEILGSNRDRLQSLAMG
jgi:hypothetical protein